MQKYLFIFFASLLWIAPAEAKRFEVPRALFSIDLQQPEYWHVMQASEFPDSSESMCYPRFRRGATTISAGLWEYQYPTVEAHIDAYFQRMNKYASGCYTKEVDRTTYRTPSGVTVVRLLVETGRNDGTHWQLLRYVFRNTANVVVCISCSGSTEMIDKIVLNTLELMPAPNTSLR
jgi:hypothetical protein